MAATVASYTGDRLVTRSPESYPPQRRTGLDEGRRLQTRIESLAGLWNIYMNGKSGTCKRNGIGYTGAISDIKDMKSLKYQSHAIHTLDILSPPSYKECLVDVPPDYTATDALAVVQGLVDVKLDLGLPRAGLRQSQRRSDSKLDFTEPYGIRYHAKKKKAAAKKNAWDDEEKKEEPPADEGAGGDAGGGDAGGDAGGGDAGGDGAGGDPPGGDGGGDDPDDIWGAAGGGKKKKKKKKNAW
jgi:hypothetical protein